MRTVFLDTSALRHAADRRIVPTTYQKTITWGGRQHAVELVRWTAIDPNRKLAEEFRKQLLLLPLFAHLSRCGRLALVTHHEVHWELAGLPPSHDSRGLFYGAELGDAPDPFHYGRVLAGPLFDADTAWLRILSEINDPDFLRLQKLTGARQGDVIIGHQMLDAFHLLTAERAHVDFFLTTDLGLVRAARSQRRHAAKVAVVDPKGLLGALAAGRDLRLRDIVSYLRYWMRTRGAGPEGHPLEQLLKLGPSNKPKAGD